MKNLKPPGNLDQNPRRFPRRHYGFRGESGGESSTVAGHMAAMEVSPIYWGTTIWRFSHYPSIDYGYVSNPF